MPRGSRSTSKKTVLGIVGLAEVSDADIKAQLDDLGVDNIESVLVMVTEPLPESVLSVLDWADDNKVPYDVVTDGENTSRDAKGVQRGAREVATASKKAVETFIEALTDGLPDDTQARIWALWAPELAEDEEANDGYAYEVLEAAEAAGIGCFDLAKGLEPLTFTEPEPEPEPEPEKTPRARRTSSRAKKTTEADEAQASAPVEADDAVQTTAEVINLGITGPSFGGFDAAFNIFADVVAAKVVALLEARATPEEEPAKPARRSRSRAS